VKAVVSADPWRNALLAERRAGATVCRIVEQLGRSGAGAPTAELGSFVGGNRNVAKKQT